MAQFQTNFFGLMNVTNAVLPHMRERRAGTIVQMGSRSAWKADTRVRRHPDVSMKTNGEF